MMRSHTSFQLASRNCATNHQVPALWSGRDTLRVTLPFASTGYWASPISKAPTLPSGYSYTMLCRRINVPGTGLWLSVASTKTAPTPSTGSRLGPPAGCVASLMPMTCMVQPVQLALQVAVALLAPATVTFLSSTIPPESGNVLRTVKPVPPAVTCEPEPSGTPNPKMSSLAKFEVTLPLSIAVPLPLVCVETSTGLAVS